MTEQLLERLNALKPAAAAGLFNQLQRGLEKETLRVADNGCISQTDHPARLGSTLTHPYITTDYSEALLEFITPVNPSREATLQHLLNLHRFALQHLPEGELLWPASMPCRLQGAQSIRIAEYGTSNVGRMKNVYRHGLDWRYGRIMQSIAGIHYNFSLPEDFWQQLAALEGQKDAQNQDWRSDKYFALIRNFRRHCWLLLYLFGATPAVDSSFLSEHPQHPLQPLGEDTWGLPYATSLRMSDLGYQNKVQAGLKVCFNSLDTYIKALQQAIRTPHPAYEAIGVQVDGEYRQLNTHLLQIENEYYSNIRPKRVTRAGQKPTDALREGGVEYIEVRCLDINPFLPGGIDLTQIRFLDTFLLFCLLQPSPQLSDTACEQLQHNQAQVVTQGRNPATRIVTATGSQPLQQAASELLQAIQPVAALLDTQPGAEGSFQQALAAQQQKVDDVNLTPSAQMLALIERHGSHQAAVWHLAQQQKEALLADPLSDEQEQTLLALSRQSLAEQRQLEAADQTSFEDFLAAYFSY